MSPLNLPDTNPAFHPRPANASAPPHAPLIGPTGSPGLNSVLDVVNTTAAPFMNAPPAEQGAAGVIAQGLGGVLGVVGAPAMIIDTAFASLTAPIAALFPSLPAVTLLGMHVGIPHAHAHPPSLIPPAPPVPLPSLGALVGSGAVTVLIGGMPAARAGDIGIALTCGSLAPPFEVYTGSSNVFIGGARAARTLDITKHCNPTSMGPFAIAMGVAGVVAGAAGAVASANLHVAAQAAADAAVLAIKLLCGKDPGIPPGMGTLVGPPVANVLIGGFPCPPIGEMALGGLMRAIGKAAAAVRRARSARRANGRCADGLHPIYLPTGEYFDSYVDYVSGGVFEWKRHVSSARSSVDGPMGRGFRHILQRSLSVRLHQAVFTDWDGVTIEFPRFERGSKVTRADGYVLQRESPNRYWLTYRNSPAMEFAGRPFDRELPLTKLRAPHGELELHYDSAGRLAECVDSRNQRRWEFQRDFDHIVAVHEEGAARQNHAPGERTLRARYRYSAAGELLDAEDALGGVWSYEYDTFHRIVKQTDPRRYSFSFSYDVLGRCVAATGEDGLWRGTIEYFPEKKVTRCTSGDNETWTYHYDNDGFVTNIIDPYGGEKVRERDSDGKVREVDCGGREVRWLYDGNGAHFARKDRFGYLHPPETESRHLRNPFARTLPNTSRSRCFAGHLAPSDEAFGRPERILDTVPPRHAAALRASIRFHEPDAVARIPVRVERDALGQTVREVDDLGRTRDWQRDLAGNVISTRDRDGGISERRISSWNLVVEHRDALGHAVRRRYSTTEHVVAIQDPLGNISGYEYDLKGRLTRVRRNNRIRDEYAYDAGDHFVEKRGIDGAILFTNQIHENHLVSMRQLASGGIHRYDYDAAGRVTVASTAEHDIQLAYDGAGRRIADLHDGAGVRHRFSDGSCDTRIFDRFAIATRTQRTHMVSLVDATGTATVVRHYRAGIVERACSNGTVEILQYDADGKLSGRFAYDTRQGATPDAWSVRYTYSAEGDLLRVADSVRGVTVFETDAAHRLIRKVTHARRETYEYDAASNVISIGGDKCLGMRDGNRLGEVGHAHYDYDERDRLATRRGPGSAFARYIYDSYDMLVRVERTAENATSLPVWEAYYDGLGRRVRTRVGTIVREFYWDGDRLAAEILPDKTFRIYQYGGRDALVPLQFTDYTNTQANPTSGRTHHVFCDQVGMPLHIEDPRGAGVWWSDGATPYGVLHVQDGAAIEYNLRWPGHYYDPDIGLHYNRYRYYDPAVARYLQPDPLGYEGSPVNLYAYCRNPIVDVDVLGLTNGSGCGPGDGGDGTRRPGDTDGREGTDDEPTNPNIKLPPTRPAQPPLAGGRYADRAVGMTAYGQRFDQRHGVVIYTPEQRETFRVVAGPSGELRYAQSGRPVHSPGGEAIYIVDQHGNMYVHPAPVDGTIHHSSLAGGEPVAAAGHIAQIGDVDPPQPPHSIDNSSGHYGENLTPGSSDMARDELQNQGVDTSILRNNDTH